MTLGNITFILDSIGIDYDQFAIDGNPPMVFNRNEAESYMWCGDLDNVLLTGGTIIAFAKDGHAIWSGILKDIEVSSSKEGVFKLDFNPLLKVTGVNVPSSRYKKIKKELEEVIEPVVEVSEVKPLIIETSAPQQITTRPLIIDTLPVEVQVQPVAVAPPKPIIKEQPKEIILNGIKLKLK